jgi:phosphoribosylglycinamide formyltransferase-1
VDREGGEPSAALRVVILLSGAGSTMAALLAPSAGGRCPFDVVAVGSDRADAGGLAIADAAGIATFTVRPADHATRAEWNTALAEAIDAHHPDLVLSAGFMRILDEAFVHRYAPWLLNTHPALLPAFPGAHAVRDALAYGVGVTGATIHVVDAGVDTGPIVAQRAVEVYPTDDESTLHERIKGVERQLLVAVVTSLATNRTLRIDGRKVHLT